MSRVIWTLGGINRRKQFSYSGSVPAGVTINFTGKPYIKPEFFEQILKRFSKRIIPGGFSMTNPTSGGLGEWTKNNSKQFNGSCLSPRHASFIAAILAHEGYIEHSLRGNAVFLEFST